MKIHTEALGLIPAILSDPDLTAQESFNTHYAHGGGWRPMGGWDVTLTDEGLCITYPGDPTLRPLATIDRGDQVIYVYPHAWVAILNADGTVEVARID